MRINELKWYQFLIGMIISIGVALRLKVYLDCRALFLDESNVARNIIEKNYLDFFIPLDYDQFVPPFLSVLIKLSTDIFGANEYALRLFPLLFGVASLFLFYHVSGKVVKNRISLLFINWVFASSYLLIQYASETKQYGVDVFVSLLLFNFALSINQEKTSTKEIVYWSLIGAFLIWCSMPSIFILTGIGIYFLLQKRTQIIQTPKRIIPFVGMGGIWLLSFFIYFYCILSQGIGSEAQQNYHSIYFLPIIPIDMESLNQWFSIQGNILNSTIGKTGIAMVGGLLFLILGWVHLFREKWKLALLFFIPIFLVSVASGLGKYSLLPRLALFYMPLHLVVMALGLDWILEKKMKWLNYGLVVLLIIIASHQWGYRMFWEKLEYEEVKPVLAYMAEHIEKNETIYVHHAAVPAFDFYTQLHDDKDSKYLLRNNPTILTEWNTVHPKLNNFPSSIWLFFSHASEDFKVPVTNTFLSHYEIEKEESSKRAHAILLVKKR